MTGKPLDHFLDHAQAARVIPTLVQLGKFLGRSRALSKEREQPSLNLDSKVRLRCRSHFAAPPLHPISRKCEKSGRTPAPCPLKRGRCGAVVVVRWRTLAPKVHPQRCGFLMTASEPLR